VRADHDDLTDQEREIARVLWVALRPLSMGDRLRLISIVLQRLAARDDDGKS